MVLRRCLLNPLRFSSTLTPKAASSKANDLYAMNKKLSDIVRTGKIHEARSMFDKMGERNTVTWNSMISGYVKRREMTQARKLFDEMPERDIVSWNLMISGYASYLGYNFLEEGKKLFEKMPRRDVVSWNTMISGYAKSGKMDEAIRLFESMPERNVVSWNAMITGFFRNGDTLSATQYFERMPERDSASVNAFVSGLVQNGELDEAARVLIECGNKDGWSEDLIPSCNTLIAGYGQKGRVDDARRLFNQIPFNSVQADGRNGVFERNVVTWNSMIMCHVKAGDILSARELFDQMVDKDTISWNTMINGYVQILDMEEALNLFNMMPKPDNLSWNSMISGYAQMGKLELARDYFEMMPQKHLVSWNALIAGYEKNEDYKGAIKFFIRMLGEGEKPDRHTLSSVLSVCTGLVDMQLGMQIHQLVSKTVIPDVPIQNSLITMYSRCGALVESRTIFDELKSPKDVISWNAMIGGYASHGFALEALGFFELMKKNKVQPTYITFISVLSACRHAGLVDEGWAYFKSMVSEYGIEPGIEHYASLIDNMARHGQFEEAMDLIKSMPFEADKEVWGALLGACRLHNNVELARVAAEALMRLEPESSAPYILLYNMYAEAGQWDAAAGVREMMEKNNIRKQTAYSSIDSSCC
ncbi:hypothetical protein ES319_A12G035800v1 [Gossypium barbadense]|uniref:Pentacotripeptide-repeat region of PRORP domain-containing protein n=3 Tax=Gossypium TaxID=3633 RepID=A0A2P5WVL5_GOSBA|nr:pentatricopeptide repeat-containing protein At1g62260, mitochondrial-like [Gossypium hirsutum]KAB2051135.1 hypothetical protein ES319_A12G035800v1 [Gossypium barbadense]PPR95099.1 hypothetical protein GOBAR_AA25570 [Gossypium barbadense]TYG88634.1 hypothetical protein ES288_A12G037500v1 [Gossypium darwinii]